MPQGYVPKKVVAREDDPIEKAFVGTAVTHADVAKLEAQNLGTVGKFAKAASDGDLTDNGMSPEESRFLIPLFEASTYADLLDYMDGPATAAENSNAKAEEKTQKERALTKSLKELGHGLTFNLLKKKGSK